MLSPISVVAAIDPGLYGAAAVVSIHPHWRIIATAAWDYRKRSGTRRRDISQSIHGSILPLLRFITPSTPIIVEDTGAMPEQGLSSTHNFGMSRASAETTFLGAGARLVPVAPSLWKRQMGLFSNKQASLRLAEPWIGRKLRVKDTNLAEAVLLTVWYAFRLAHLRLAPEERAKFGLIS
jgi:hypothetical protein